MAPAEQVLHIYRRLLRAVTYVPDSFARAYAHDFIKSRFKANCHPVNLKKPNAKALTTNRIKKARHWTRILESATEGSLEDLHKVLLHVYGRQGARKRVLLRQFLQPDEDHLPKDDSALEDLINKPIAESTRIMKPGTKLHALGESQLAHHPPVHEKAKLRRLEPDIPAENIWARPTPKRLVESLRKRWWAKNIDKLLPPVPRNEWERLRDLASGAMPLEEPPPRRARPPIPDSQLDKHLKAEQLLDALRAPARPARFGLKNLEFDTSNGLLVGKLEDQIQKVPSPFRARSLRRMYASIGILTPSLTQDEVTKRWVVEWGGQKSRALNGFVSKPNAQELELFEGSNSDADGVKPLSRRQAKKQRGEMEQEEAVRTLEL